jgi:hypothetical protein
MGIRLGHALEELAEGLFPLRLKLPNVIGYHRRHGYPFNTLSYALCSIRQPFAIFCQPSQLF